jgi:hypothetical protein
MLLLQLPIIATSRPVADGFVALCSADMRER